MIPNVTHDTLGAHSVIGMGVGGSANDLDAPVDSLSCSRADPRVSKRSGHSVIETIYHALTGERHQFDFPHISRLETDGVACGDVQAEAAGGCAVEVQGAVGLVKVVVAAYLYGTVSGIGHFYDLGD